jgi:hypothetical protein
MLAITHHRGASWLPGNHRMSDVPEATAKARRLIAHGVCPSAVSRAGSSKPCSRIQRRRARATSARCCSAAYRLFFNGEIVATEETAHSTATAGDARRSFRHHNLIQGQIGLYSNQVEKPLRIFFQWRYAAAARLGHRTSRIAPTLHPFNDRARAHAKLLGRLAPRSSGPNLVNSALPKVIRIRSRHRFSPSESICSRGRLAQCQDDVNPSDSTASGYALVRISQRDKPKHLHAFERKQQADCRRDHQYWDLNNCPATLRQHWSDLKTASDQQILARAYSLRRDFAAEWTRLAAAAAVPATQTLTIDMNRFPFMLRSEQITVWKVSALVVNGVWATLDEQWGTIAAPDAAYPPPSGTPTATSSGGPRSLALKLVAKFDDAALYEFELGADSSHDTQAFDISTAASNSKWTISLNKPAASYRDVIVVVWWKLAQS